VTFYFYFQHHYSSLRPSDDVTCIITIIFLILVVWFFVTIIDACSEAHSCCSRHVRSDEKTASSALLGFLQVQSIVPGAAGDIVCDHGSTLV
jgi:hypothetical protein